MLTSLIALSGSLRQNSWNTALATVAAEAAQAAGAKVTLLSLADFSIPLYNGDIEEQDGLPTDVVALKKLFSEHDGLLLASPEYNGSISGVLKNTIDWLSRPHPEFPSAAVFKNKAGALFSTSTGYFGGIQGLTHVRPIVERLGMFLIPQNIAVPNAGTAFSPDKKTLADPKRQEGIVTAVADVIRLSQKLRYTPTS